MNRWPLVAALAAAACHPSLLDERVRTVASDVQTLGSSLTYVATQAKASDLCSLPIDGTHIGDLRCIPSDGVVSATRSIGVSYAGAGSRLLVLASTAEKSLLGLLSAKGVWWSNVNAKTACIEGKYTQLYSSADGCLAAVVEDNSPSGAILPTADARAPSTSKPTVAIVSFGSPGKDGTCDAGSNRARLDDVASCSRGANVQTRELPAEMSIVDFAADYCSASDASGSMARPFRWLAFVGTRSLVLANVTAKPDSGAIQDLRAYAVEMPDAVPGENLRGFFDQNGARFFVWQPGATDVFMLRLVEVDTGHAMLPPPLTRIPFGTPLVDLVRAETTDGELLVGVHDEDDATTSVVATNPDDPSTTKITKVALPIARLNRISDRGCSLVDDDVVMYPDLTHGDAPAFAVAPARGLLSGAPIGVVDVPGGFRSLRVVDGKTVVLEQAGLKGAVYRADIRKLVPITGPFAYAFADAEPDSPLLSVVPDGDGHSTLGVFSKEGVRLYDDFALAGPAPDPIFKLPPVGRSDAPYVYTFSHTSKLGLVSTYRYERDVRAIRGFLATELDQ